MKRDHRENTVGPWAEQKLKALEDYLEFYGTALSKQNFQRIYIDAFAGACISKVRGSDAIVEPSPFFDDQDGSDAQTEFIIGSPIRALNIKHKFHRYYFFDMDETRTSELAKVTHGRTDVTVRVGDCNPMIQQLAPMLKAKGTRGVAFLDPYGANLEWATLKSLAETGNMEVVINFPVAMAINRLIARSGSIRETWSKQLNDCFGTDEWRTIAYNRTVDLFGNESVTKNDGVADRLLELYVSRLKAIFPHVAKPRLIRNTKQTPLYYLLWAGPNALGLRGAQHVLGYGEALPRK